MFLQNFWKIFCNRKYVWRSLRYKCLEKQAGGLKSSACGQIPQTWEPTPQMEPLWESLCGSQEQGLAYKQDSRSQQPGSWWKGQCSHYQSKCREPRARCQGAFCSSKKIQTNPYQAHSLPQSSHDLQGGKGSLRSKEYILLTPQCRRPKSDWPSGKGLRKVVPLFAFQELWQIWCSFNQID